MPDTPLGGDCVHVHGPAGTAIVLTVARSIDPTIDAIESLARVTGLPVFVVEGKVSVAEVDALRLRSAVEALAVAWQNVWASMPNRAIANARLFDAFGRQGLAVSEQMAAVCGMIGR